MSAATFLEWARVELTRMEPEESDELRRAGGLLIDIRPLDNRRAEGEIPDAIPVERIVLEWRLDPRGTGRLPELTEDTRVVVFCNDGTASSLAARDLKRIGLHHATDLVGGYRAGRAAGLPTREGGSQAVI